MRTICFTSFTFSYLARARVLARTLRAVHPDWELWAVITDSVPDALHPQALAAFHRVVFAETLDVPVLRRFLFAHDIVEAATAVKGAMLRHVLAAPGVARAVYLDPDIAVFAPLDPVLAAPDGPAIVLTPHQTIPNHDAAAIRDGEATALRYGVFNLGFLSVANDAVGHAFADWWHDCLLRACFDAPEQGLFTDQKYCDLAPALFPRVLVARDPGCNVASWNLSTRHLAFDPEGRPQILTADGACAPLRFYHFSKVDGPGALMTERYAAGNAEAHELLAWYRRQLAAETDPAAAAHPWAYGYFADGTAIPRAARLLWRTRADLRARIADPFAQDLLTLFAQDPAACPPTDPPEPP